MRSTTNSLGRLKNSAPAAELEERVRAELDSAVHAFRNGSKVYQSLQNLNEVIGTEYGDRVLYELIQNAHDAHRSGNEGRIAIRLAVTSESCGTLYVANGGTGFREDDVEAIRNLAVSAKDVGEGIGNKGLGFRSIESLTDDVRIYSRNGDSRSTRFDGYCFRFATTEEIENLLCSHEAAADVRHKAAQTIPRYLIPVSLEDQPVDVVSFARRGYATVIVAPLQTAEAVDLATRQVEALAKLDVPLLLFLDRIGEVRIDMETPGGKPYRRHLQRRQTSIGSVPSLAGTHLYSVDVGDGRRFLLVRREIEKERVIAAVERSIQYAPQLKRWLDWKGQPAVSVAVGLTTAAITEGRLYNFLPMGEEATSPLLGYLDAPFFADIDRREADLDLPLNETLMKAAAEASAAAALHIVENAVCVPRQAPFDLSTWTGSEASKLDDALRQLGSSRREARVIPTYPVGGGRVWSSISEAKIWPDGKFVVLKKRDVAKYVGACLVSDDLDDSRLHRLRRIAGYLSPNGQQLANWGEAFAHSMLDRNVAPRTWSLFYTDLHKALEAVHSSLQTLNGKKILLDQTKKLREAGGDTDNAQARVFVRTEPSKGKRLKDGVPLPPSALVRRFRFLEEKISIRRDTLNAFIEAELVREFDPVDILSELETTLTNRANPNRRREALEWAFRVWDSAGTRAETPLQNAGLHVPTMSGWHAATEVSFSASWSSVGKILENYLFECAEISSDCKLARDRLTLPYDQWPSKNVGTKRRWSQFLELIGVFDGLRPVPARLFLWNTSGEGWNSLLLSGREAEGLDSHWCSEVAGIRFNHPVTDDYRVRGHAWRLPGQLEHDDLSETGKNDFCSLIFDHLGRHRTGYFEFEVGRFERYNTEWDDRQLPTPLATFLRSRSWVTTNTPDGNAFRKPRECWSSSATRGGPPRFVDRVPDHLISVSVNDEFTDVVFGEAVGILDWQSITTAVQRLRDLAAATPTLSTSDRRIFRQEYHRAWNDVSRIYSHPHRNLPSDLPLAVTRHGQLEELIGDRDAPPEVVVVHDAHRFEAQILSGVGQAVLEIGEISPALVTRLLESIGTFTPRPLEGVGVRLLVDKDNFVPQVDDPLLTSFGLEWLPAIAVIAHELRGEQLERAIHSQTIERRLRSIRVRFCDSIALEFDGKQIATEDRLECYAFEHETLPTLILTRDIVLDWPTLARTLSGDLSRLIDTRLRSLKFLLLQLGYDRPSSELEIPSDEALSRALECPVKTISEYRIALRTDLAHLLHLLVPVVGYFKGIELARQLSSDANTSGAGFDIAYWLELHLANTGISVSRLMADCEKAADRAVLQKTLELDYERINRVLLDMGEPLLASETDLKQLYAAYLEPMRSKVIDRLRRHHLSDFRESRDLSTYVDRKTLDFLTFDPEWVITRETLEQEVVEAHVNELLDEALGPDRAAALPAYARLMESNRKVVREFAVNAIPVVRVWCSQSGVTEPDIWSKADPQLVARFLENAGLLDFEAINLAQVATLCIRAGIWPENMLNTLDNKKLGLAAEEVGREEQRRVAERQRIEVERRSIVFAGRSLDTGSPTFAVALQEMMNGFLAEDERWHERSRQQPRLDELGATDRTATDRRGGSGTGGGRRPERQLSEDQRQAMGLAGEWLAYQFLRRRHGNAVDETCWISENRAKFFGGTAGDDSAGYDFLVKTPRVDWLYEVKSTLEDGEQFELTDKEIRVASSASSDRSRRYRILYVPFVFSPEKWCVIELPNPMNAAARNRFSVVGRGSVRFKFQRR